MLRHFAICTMFVLASGLAYLNSAASAAIMSVDDTEFGTGALTRDTDQGLDFLDVRFSTNRSYDAVSAQFGAGGDFEGFRYATIQEVVNLINNWGFSPTITSFNQTIGNTGSDQLSDLVALLGGPTDPGSSINRLEGLATALPQSLPFVSRIILADFINPTQNDDVSFNLESSSSFSPDYGSFLVKDSSSGEIPEPTSCVTFAGLALCMAAAGRWRKRRRRPA